MLQKQAWNKEPWLQKILNGCSKGGLKIDTTNQNHEWENELSRFPILLPYPDIQHFKYETMMGELM